MEQLGNYKLIKDTFSHTEINIKHTLLFNEALNSVTLI